MEKQQSKRPLIRFPEFNDAWEHKRLSDIAKFSKGKGITKADIVLDGNTECIRYGELYTKYGDSISEIFSRTNIELKSLVLSEENDVIIPASGESQLDIAKASCVLKSGVALGGDLNIIKTQNDGVFLSLYLNSKKKIDIANLAQGISVIHLYSSQLATLNLNLPTIPEQKRIASFFTVLDKKIAELKQKKNLLEQYKKGVMQRLFCLNDDSLDLHDLHDFEEKNQGNQKNHNKSRFRQLRFKDENGKEFPKWEIKKLGEIFRIKTEKYNPAKETYSVKCIELEHLATDTGKLLGYVEGSDLNSIKNKFESGDVLFGKLRPYLKKYLRPNFDGVCSSEIWVLKGVNVSNDFLYWLIQTDAFIEVANKSSGSKMPRADWSLISTQHFEYPKQEEQTKIANFLFAIDDKINRTENQIQQTQQYKKGLLQKMFV